MGNGTDKKSRVEQGLNLCHSAQHRADALSRKLAPIVANLIMIIEL